MKFQDPRFGFPILVGFLLSVFSLATLAADPPIFADEKGAIRGADPVAYFSLEPGDEATLGTNQFTYEWMGATWTFANAKNRDLFSANPEAYAPQYGGYCAFAVSHNFTKPVEPDVWEIVDGKLYMNSSPKAYEKWATNKSAAIISADANWPTALKSCEEHDNCS